MNLTMIYWGWEEELSKKLISEIDNHFDTKRKNIIHDHGENVLSATTIDASQAGGTHAGKKPLPSNILPSEAAKSGTLNDYYIRDTDVVFDDDEKLYDIFGPFFNGANQSAGWNFDWRFMEPVQYARYEPGQFYSWHPDSLPGERALIKYDNDNPEHRLEGAEEGEFIIDEVATLDYGHVRYMPKEGYTDNENLVGLTRKITLIASLTEQGVDYEGGDFWVDFGTHNEGEQFQVIEGLRKAGTVVVMPSFIYHRVAPVTSGLRKSIVIWANGPPWK